MRRSLSKTCGTGCVIAKSFARIFYRNAINIGLPILECEQAAEEIIAGDEVRVDFDTGEISDITTGKTYKGTAVPAVYSEHNQVRRTA